MVRYATSTLNVYTHYLVEVESEQIQGWKHSQLSNAAFFVIKQQLPVSNFW